jgi:multidrug efflux pump subunit AcrA (membrane-fusion protein)
LSDLLRRWVPPVAALAIGASIALFVSADDAPRSPVRVVTLPASPTGEPGPAHDPKVPVKDPDPWTLPWHAQPVRPRTIPLFEKLVARWASAPPVAVRAEVRAPVKEVLVKPGAAVVAGQTLLRMNGEPWEKERAAAEKAGDAARVAKAAHVLANLEVRSPADGVVFEIVARLGDIPLTGEKALPVAILFDWKSLRLDADAPEALAAFLAPGTYLGATLGDATAFEVEVASLGEPAPDGTRRLVVVPREPPTAAPDDAAATARILVPTGTRDVLAVPQSSVKRRGDRDFVRVVGVTGTLVETEVALGTVVGEGLVEVVRGVRRFESVAVPGPSPAPPPGK